MAHVALNSSINVWAILQFKFVSIIFLQVWDVILVYVIRVNHWCYNCYTNVKPSNRQTHDDVIKWKHFPCYWPFVRGIHQWPVNSHKGLWRGALIFSLICAWINSWVNNREAGDLKRHRAHYGVIVVEFSFLFPPHSVRNPVRTVSTLSNANHVPEAK